MFPVALAGRLAVITSVSPAKISLMSIFKSAGLTIILFSTVTPLNVALRIYSPAFKFKLR